MNTARIWTLHGEYVGGRPEAIWLVADMGRFTLAWFLTERPHPAERNNIWFSVLAASFPGHE